MRIFYTILLILIISGLNAFSQKSDISFTHLTMDDGLSQSAINCMLQDKEGFIWFGTQGGLNKYNGSSSQPFKVYLHSISDTNSLSSSWVYGISEDNSGNMWIATVSGLDKFDRKTGNIIRYLHDPEDPQTISGNRIFGVLVDSRGYIWAKTIDAINRLDTATGEFTRFAHHIDYFISPNLNYSFPLFEDSKTNLWIGTQYGLFIFDNDYETWKVHSVKNCDISDNHVNTIHEDSKGNLWIGTKNGLNKFNYKTGEFINYFHNDLNPTNSISNNDVRAIYEDHLGNLWIGTFGGGLNMFDSETEEFRFFMPKVNDPNAISHPLVISIIEDNSHILWVGTYGGAVNKIDLKSKKFNLFTQHNFGLNYNDMAAIYEEDDILWIGTWGGGLNLYNKKIQRIELITSKSKGKRKLINDFIHVIKKDSRGYIWIGTRNGINIYNKKTDEFTILKDFFKENNILSGDEIFRNIRINEIIEDKFNNMWIGTSGGLYSINFETKSVNAFTHKRGNEESLSNNDVYAILEDKEGFIWLGTVANGLNRYNPVTGVFKRYQSDINNPNSISNNRVFDIIEDSEGLIWIATGSGLNKFNKKDTSFTIYTKNDGLPSDLIYNIIEDNNKNLWMSTGYGFAMFDRKTNSFKSYDKTDGLGSLALNFGSIYKSKSGEIFIGGTGGLNSFYPDSLFENPNKPKIVFLKYTKNNYDGIFTEPLENVKEIELFHNDHTITIYFAALEFTNPEENKYKYKMEGLSDDWTNLENQNFQTFSNLPAGDYVLTVIGSNNDQIWNEEGVSLRIKVYPPYWQTTWAYLTYLVLLVLFVYNIIRRRAKKDKKDKMVLETKVKERTYELNQQKEELQITIEELNKTQHQLVESEKMASLGNLVAGVAHEINTPVGIGITASSALIEKTKKIVEKYKKDVMKKSDFEDYMQIIYNTSKLILNNLERTGELVQSFKQVSVDQTIEERREFNFGSYLHDVVRSVMPKLKNTGIELEVISPEDIIITSYPGAFAQIVTNLIVNSKIHAYNDGDKGKIEIKASRKGKELILEYTDDGKGMTAEVKEKIFDPFFTTNKQEGTGLGMHIIYNLVTQKLNGTINCESEEGKGVKFIIIISKI